MNKTETAKQIITKTAHATRTTATYLYKGTKLFIQELTKPTNNKTQKCIHCGKPSGKYPLCYNCHQKYKRHT